MAISPYIEDLGPFLVGDSPTGALVLEFTEDDAAVELPDGVLEATVRGPLTIVPTILTITRDPELEDRAAITWPPTVFALPGVYALRVTVDGATLTPIRFVVESDDSGWVTLAEAREDWADAPRSDATLYGLLESAREACLRYGPPRISTQIPTPSTRLAQLMQARSVWNAVKASGEQEVGPDGMVVRIYPLDFNVRALLRPKSAKPVIR